MIARLLTCFLAANLPGAGAVAAELRPATVAAFDTYVAQAEARIRQEQSTPQKFLLLDEVTPQERVQADAAMRRGEVWITTRGKNPVEIKDGLIHHWVGTVFLPGAKVADTLALVQDYDHLARYYSPEVMASRLLSRDGDHFTLSMRVRKHKVITVVMDTDYDVRYGRLDAGHAYSFSHSTRIAELADAGENDEHALPPGDDHGFLWRLYTYWRFMQASDGVYVQCEAISLTRDVPAGLGWLIGPFIRGIPRESLTFTLASTRKGVEARGKTPAASSMRQVASVEEELWPRTK
jgi:hypothetical protein